MESSLKFLGANVGLGNTFIIVWKIVQWPAVLALMFLTFSLIYYFAPNLEKPEWHWITPGAAGGSWVSLVAFSGKDIRVVIGDLVNVNVSSSYKPKSRPRRAGLK